MAEFDHGHGSENHSHDSAGVAIEATSQNNSSSSGSSGSSIQSESTSNALDQIDNGDGTFTHTHDDGTVETHSFSGPGGDGDHNHSPSENPLPSMGDYNQLNGTNSSDTLIGDAGNDFIFPGEDSFSFNTATGGGGTEFPFVTDSSGTSEITADLNEDGLFTLNGSFENFEGAPLFSQGEEAIDPNAEILNGSDPQALVNGFLAVDEDAEGNVRSGTHLHFSPAGDDRGDFADATVVRFFENDVNPDGKSGTVSGEFELSPDEQAALLAGNLYTNIHTNQDVDADGSAGFPTGENRLNFNQNVVQFA